jgi:SAM-dependent methyltransferase
MKKDNNRIKKIVKEGYTNIAKGGCSCNCGCGVSNKEISKSIGYSDKEINNVPEANLGLGCGNPLALSKIKLGDIVVDFGSGAGFDVFIAANKVGKTGKVIGIDMTEKMIEKARANAKRYDYKNVEFKLGDIENVPLPNNFADAIISNCVINLAPNKDKVFSEAYRILKKGGKIYLSDIVLLDKLNKNQMKNNNLLVGCVAGASQKEEYIKKIKNAGFKVKILDEDKSISKTQYSGIPLESLKLECTK